MNEWIELVYMEGVGRSDAALIIICWRLSFSFELRGCSQRMISIFRSFRDDDPLCLPSQCVHSENHIWIFCIIKWIANMWGRFLSVCVREEYNSTQTLYFDLILLLIQLNRIDYLTSIWINSKLSISLNSICLFPNRKTVVWSAENVGSQCFIRYLIHWWDVSRHKSVVVRIDFHFSRTVELRAPHAYDR